MIITNAKHVWKKIYEGADVEACEQCKIERRPDGCGKFQYRLSPDSPRWYDDKTGGAMDTCSYVKE